MDMGVSSPSPSAAAHKDQGVRQRAAATGLRPRRRSCCSFGWPSAPTYGRDPRDPRRLDFPRHASSDLRSSSRSTQPASSQVLRARLLLLVGVLDVGDLRRRRAASPGAGRRSSDGGTTSGARSASLGSPLLLLPASDRPTASKMPPLNWMSSVPQPAMQSVRQTAMAGSTDLAGRDLGGMCSPVAPVSPHSQLRQRRALIPCATTTLRRLCDLPSASYTAGR